MKRIESHSIAALSTSNMNGKPSFAWAVSYAANSKILPWKWLPKLHSRRTRMRSVVWEVVGNPFRSVYFNPARTDAALSPRDICTKRVSS